MSDRNLLTRRDILGTAGKLATATGAFPYILSASALGKGLSAAPSERIHVGCIGCGPQGSGVLGNFLSEPDARVVAVCDVWQKPLEAMRHGVERYYHQQQNADSPCRSYHDFRELLAADDIDAVLIAVPDHWHTTIAQAAVRAGKDVYLEKPIGLSVEQADALRQTVKRYGAVFQFGTQQRSDMRFRRACELVRNGLIGELRQVRAWCFASVRQPSMKIAPPPQGLDYDMWVGPGEFRPYSVNRCSGAWRKKTWWYESAYSSGFIAGWGIHPLDIARWGAGHKMNGRLRVRAQAVYPRDGVCDTAVEWKVLMETTGGVKLDFRSQPICDEWATRYGRNFNHGTAFEGSQGWVYVDREMLKTSSQTLANYRFGSNDLRLYRSAGHVRNFLDCIRTRRRTISNIDEAFASDTLCRISDIAARTGTELLWDPCQGQFENNEQANRLLRRPVRREFYNI